MSESAREEIVRLPGEGERTVLFGDTYVVKASGDVYGKYGLEVVGPPPATETA